MDRPIINTDWKYRGLETIIMDNGLIKVDLFPELGAKIRQITHKPSGTEFFWENPRLVLRPVSHGASYDDNFFGGWDELLPNDDPITINGEPCPDHGELWTQPWQYEILENSNEKAVVHLWCYGSALNFRMDKWIEIERGNGRIKFQYGIKNQSAEAFDFLWKLHPAMNISPVHRIDLPACRVLRVDDNWSDIVGEESFDWPICKGKRSGKVDLRNIFREQGHFKEFLYAVDLQDGWCAFTDSKEKIGFGMIFPLGVFRSVWLFITDGGWRGYRTAVLEPCSAFPKEIDIAAANGTCSHLGPDESIECETEAIIYSGIYAVESAQDMMKNAVRI